MSRRWSGALTVLLAVALTVVGLPAPARASGAPSGGFTYAYAENPAPVLDQSTVVWFGASVPLGNVVVVLTDEKGTYLTECYQGNTCTWLVNPGPGETKTITAVLRTQVDGQRVVLDTASVSVTDPGYAGDFSYAYAENPSPVVDQSTLVWFGVSEPLNAAVIDIRDETGTLLVECYQRDTCPWLVNPSPGETKTYTATLRVYLDGHWVDRSTRSVTVTDPAWTGTISPDTSNPGFVQANTQAWFHFTTTAPPYSTTINVYVDGALQASCGGNGNANCGANFPVGTNEVHVVRADVIPYLIGGTQEVRASATSVVTSKTSAQFADFLLTATPVELEATFGTGLATEVEAFQQATRVQSFCFSLGLSRPTFRLRMSIPDLTAVCVAAGALAVFAYLLHEVGFDATLQVALDAADNPANLDPLDPNYPAGGGLNPDGTQCHQYDFDGNCIEGLEPNPEPALQVAADGARIPPPLNCVPEPARTVLEEGLNTETHHIITRYANQAPEGASDILIERQFNLDRLQAIAESYKLSIEGNWNLIRIPHRGPHPNGYHKWLFDQANAINVATGGDVTVFLALWDILVRDVLQDDPTIVTTEYWSCNA